MASWLSRLHLVLLVLLRWELGVRTAPTRKPTVWLPGNLPAAPTLASRLVLLQNGQLGNKLNTNLMGWWLSTYIWLFWCSCGTSLAPRPFSPVNPLVGCSETRRQRLGSPLAWCCSRMGSPHRNLIETNRQHYTTPRALHGDLQALNTAPFEPSHAFTRWAAPNEARVGGEIGRVQDHKYNRVPNVLPKISTKIRNSGHVLTDFFTQFSTDFSQTHPAPRSLRLLPNHLLVPVLLPKICATATNWGLCWIVTKSRCFQRPCLGFVRALWVEISCSEGTHGAQNIPYRGGSCWKRPGGAQSPP